jgi:hypothetical protein
MDKKIQVKILKGGSLASTTLVKTGDKKYVQKSISLGNSAKLREQYNWMLDKLDLEFIPNVISEEESEKEYSFQMEFVDSHLPFKEFIEENITLKSYDILCEILNSVQDAFYSKGVRKKSRDKLEAYIDQKVIKKISDSLELQSLNSLGTFEKLVINGSEYDNIFQILDKIKVDNCMMNDLADFYECNIHGDLTVENIIITEQEKFKLIDSNNENIISCPFVDYAKLYQSLRSGYEYLLEVKDISVENNSINYSCNINGKYTELFECLKAYLGERYSGSELAKILFHEAVHYCRLLPYRIKSDPSIAAVFYAQVVICFNDFYQEYRQLTQ